MADPKSADYEPLVTREQAENAFRKALSLFVGRGRRYSIDQLEKGTGVPKRSIECFKSYPLGHPDYRPLHFGHKMSITEFLGADFTNEWLSLARQGAFDLPDEEPDPGELAADTCENASKVVRMAVDGFDNDCPTDLTRTGGNLMKHGAKLVAIGTRGKRKAA